MKEFKKLIKAMEKLEHEYRVKVCKQETTIARERYGCTANGIRACITLAKNQLKQIEDKHALEIQEIKKECLRLARAVREMPD